VLIGHTLQHVKRLAGSTPQDGVAAEQFFAAEYDASLSYRVIEALRNYAQHCGLPAHVITYQSRWVDHDKPDAAKLVHGVSPSLSLKHLANDTRFKASANRPKETHAQLAYPGYNGMGHLAVSTDKY
jgi:hypothetical protein